VVYLNGGDSEPRLATARGISGFDSFFDGGLYVFVASDLSQSGFLSFEFTQVVKPGTSYATATYHFDLFKTRRMQRERTLYANASRPLSNTKSSSEPATGLANYQSSKCLDSFFVSFADSVVNFYGVAYIKRRELSKLQGLNGLYLRD
jgi:hypothetical protein